jgi:2-(1,2-epoxy-1,2-dihydrophenyl)acetyl-CoA isomerase
MTYDRLMFEVRDGIAFITLNRPDALNTIDVELVSELADVALHCDGDSDIRAVVLGGAGKVFCAGGDLRSFIDHAGEGSRYVKEVTTHLHTAVSRFARMDQPVIAAVHGAAAGAGMSLACACDIVLAAESARFTLAYTRVGLTPDGSASYFLPRIVGHKRALDLALTNRTLTAREAQEWGLVSRVVADDDLAIEVESLARRLAAGPTETFGATKRLLQLSWSESLETQMAHETQTIAGIAVSPQAREGMAAFVQKREPVFRSRD